MDGNLGDLSRLVHDGVLPFLMKKDGKILLVGAGHDESSSLRGRLAALLQKHRPYYPLLQIYYPESIFEELFIGPGSYDLLSLENILARSVHGVVIILESPGAIAELGAFCNHSELVDKVVVVVNSKYARARSFIMNGPVRFLKQKRKQSVIFHSFSDSNLKKLDTEIRSSLNQIIKNSTIDPSLSNPLVTQFFFLSILYVTDALSQDQLYSCVRAIEQVKSSTTEPVVKTSISLLINSHEVARNKNLLSLTERGRERLDSLISEANSSKRIKAVLDWLRIKSMHSQLRGVRI